MGDNLLEVATRPGVSDKASMDAFKNAGALDKESSWKGYKVRKYEAVYHPDGKLAMVTFALVKSLHGSKLASLDNLQASMTPQCGDSWSRTNDGNVGILQTKVSASGLTCSVLDQGRDTVVVSIANMTLGDAAKSTGSSAVPGAVAPTSPAVQIPSVSQEPTAATGIQTVAGTLMAVAKANSENTSELKLNGRLVFDGSESTIRIEKTFAIEGKTAVLLAISDGGTACPAVYRILSISPDGRIFTSDEFGTCSDLVKATAGKSSLMISMPNMDGKDESSWMFSGETLNQVRGGSRPK
jgi:hypothetical protein